MAARERQVAGEEDLLLGQPDADVVGGVGRSHDLELDGELAQVQGDVAADGEVRRAYDQVAVVGGQLLGRLQPGAQDTLAAEVVADDRRRRRQEPVAVRVVRVVVGVHRDPRTAFGDPGHLGEQGAVALLRRRRVDQQGVARRRRSTTPQLLTIQPPSGWTKAKTPGASSSRYGVPSSQLMPSVSRRKPCATRDVGITRAYHCHAPVARSGCAAPLVDCGGDGDRRGCRRARADLRDPVAVAARARVAGRARARRDRPVPAGVPRARRRLRRRGQRGPAHADLVPGRAWPSVSW